MNALEVDASLRAPAVVFGSLPPEGRDLDLLVSRAEADRLRSVMLAAGWVSVGRTLARFADCSAYAVDIFDASTWAPTERVVSALFERSIPIPGYEWLRAPAPHHRLLILAHRDAGGDRLAPKHLAALQTFDESTWATATREAAQWGHELALDRLRQLASAPSAHDPRARTTGRRRRSARVVALSGLDGCGKSTQATHLCNALERLGLDARVQWTKIGRDPALSLIAAPVKAVLRRLPEAQPPLQPHGAPEEAEERNFPDGPPPEPDAASRWRQRVPLLTWGWTFVVALANAANHRRSTSRGDQAVVVCDRYVLDSQAHLRYRYPSARHFGPQSRLLQLLSPRPACEIFLDVSPATARARKAEQYTTADLVRLRENYLRAAARRNVLVVDADRPPAEVAAEVGEAAWRALATRRSPWGRAAGIRIRSPRGAWQPGSGG